MKHIVTIILALTFVGGCDVETESPTEALTETRVLEDLPEERRQEIFEDLVYADEVADELMSYPDELRLDAEQAEVALDAVFTTMPDPQGLTCAQCDHNRNIGLAMCLWLNPTQGCFAEAWQYWSACIQNCT